MRIWDLEQFCLYMGYRLLQAYYKKFEFPVSIKILCILALQFSI